MTRPLAIMTLIIALTVGCINQGEENETAVSEFNLRRDLFDFSTKMTDLDTLTIYANLSACVSRRKEINTLTKKDGQVSISGSVVGDYIDDQDKELEKVKYNYLAIDTLNLENLFQNMHHKNAEIRQNSSQVFTIVYKQNTIKYFSNGLIDHLNNMDYYTQIKRRLYPEVEVYQPVIAPPKPKNDKKK